MTREVRHRCSTQEFDELRRGLDRRLHRRVLGVENAQRIAVEATLGIGIEHVLVLLEVGHQRIAVRAPFFGLAQAVQFETNMLAFHKTQFTPQRANDQDHLGIDVGARKAERFHVELVELSIAPLLRLLVAEHRAHGPDAQRAVVERVVLDHRAHDAGRRFGTQGQLVAVHRVDE